MPARNARAKSAAVQRLREQDIVDAALKVIRKAGGDKLSMRTLAAQLRVTPMAIYHHVPNKGALLDLVIDAVLGTVPMPAPDPERWHAQMKAYNVACWQAVSAYPELSRIMLSRPLTRAGRTLVRYGISILLAAGFDSRNAAMAIATLNTYLYGVYAALSALAQPGFGGARRPRRRSNGATDEIAVVARELTELRITDWLDFGLDTVLAGIAARAQPKLATAKPRARA